MSGTTTDTQSTSRRDQLLETATELFYRNGCHTTGIDKVLAEAGVAKMTLYKHFKSKDNLVLAACERFHEKVREEFEETVNEEGLTARERLEALFDFMDRWSRREEFWGCPSINLAVQYPEHDHPIHQAAAEHKQFRMDYVTDLAEQAGLSNPRETARQLVLLIEGVTVMVQVTGDHSLVASAREGARTLIARAAGERS
ncbi:TetR/AcrR family transcriptional regulator [Aquisalimonas lutea]|uniref:TetR/AcrR family transcriptional regulator n=1 Tax=Aquisalimonas lutea TaxID=1327750 RepID=UPI0025B4D7D6|nr:TetR/AcrR family transcriptional regulator [Aquisalimonas lutea]MDN3517888.1 TetR/AcrR family transcriptional regulator [Aquisalimonas lutea]